MRNDVGIPPPPPSPSPKKGNVLTSRRNKLTKKGPHFLQERTDRQKGHNLLDGGDNRPKKIIIYKNHQLKLS